MNNKNFIRTSDKETAEKLRQAGFTELNENSAVTSYCFLNDGKFDFSSEDMSNVVFTNKMYG